MKNRNTYHATFTVEVRVDLLLKGGLVEVAGTDGNTEGNGLLLSLAGNVLPDSDGRVDATALLEESADGTTRALGGDKDDIDVLGNLNVSVLLVHNGETVREVEGLALGDKRADLGPCLGLGSIGEEVHDDGTTVNGLLDAEESLSGDPTILDGLSPGLAVLADTDNDVEAVVAGVEALTMTLRTVADEGKSIVLEVVLKLGKRPVAAFVDDLLGAGEVKSLDTTGSLCCVSHVLNLRRGNIPWGRQPWLPPHGPTASTTRPGAWARWWGVPVVRGVQSAEQNERGRPWL